MTRTDAFLTPLEPRLCLHTIADPTGQEQLILELINHARTNPTAYIQRVLNSTDPDVQNQLNFFGVNRTVLAQQFAALTPQPPIAWNPHLFQTAQDHNHLMITARTQDTVLPGEQPLGQRIINSGYAALGQLTGANELIFGHSRSPFETVAAFLVSWQPGAPDGISDPPATRDTLFSPFVHELGATTHSVPAGSPPFGPNALTIDLASRTTFSPVLLGVAYDDNVTHDAFYSPGEGLPNLTVTATRASDNATFSATTSATGAYALPLPAGTYSLSITGPGLLSPFSQSNITIANQNVKVDAAQDTYVAPTPDPDPTPDPTPVPPSNLAVTLTKLPTSILPGQKAPLTITLTNKGTAFAGLVTTTVYFSKDKKIDPRDKSLPPVTFPATIAADKARSLTIDAAPFASLLPTGSYHILVRIAPAGDTTPANNTASSTTPAKLTRATTNVVPTLTNTPTPNAQKKLPFTLTLKNTGTAPAAGTALLSLSLRPTKGGTDIPLPPLAPIPLNIKPNATLKLSRSTSLATLPKGTYKLVVKLTTTLLLPESNTKDNTLLSLPFTLK